MKGARCWVAMVSAALSVKAFRQEEVDRQPVEHGHSRGYKCRYAVSPLAEGAAGGWADDEAKPKGCADHPQTPGAVLLVGNVGNIRLGDGQVATGQPVEDAAEKEQTDDDQIRRLRGDVPGDPGAQRLCHAQKHKSQECAGNREQ